MARKKRPAPATKAKKPASIKPQSTRKKSVRKRTPAKRTRAPAANARKRTAEELATGQREISVSEFFTKNRHLLGFDNPRKALLTATKEAVDNALDACEEAGILPDISVRICPVKDHDDRLCLVVEDNGPGIVPRQVPLIFGKLLYGSKFHRLKMSRGQQGIGISAAGMYGQLTTGTPTRILSRTSPRKPAYACQVVLDTKTNQPHVVKEHEEEWDHKHGTRVTIELQTRYTRGKQSVEEYLHQIAVANPHVAITFQPPGELPVVLKRVSTALPPEPREIKPHPYGIELGILIRMLRATKSRQLGAFLHQDFSRVSTRAAAEICERADLKTKARPSQIAKSQADKLHNSLQQTKLMKPPTDCVVPIGADLLLKGLKSGVEADFYHSVTRPPAVYRGNPFLVEVGIAYGGELKADRVCRMLRFANRVPLLYQQGACAVTRAIGEAGWRNYGIQQSGKQLPVGPLAVAVHIASVWVPFTSESKEAIAHYPEILKEIRLAVQECGRHLSRYISRRRRQADAERKRQYIERYIPHIGAALREILSLTERQEAKVVNKLEDILERSRKM